VFQNLVGGPEAHGTDSTTGIQAPGTSGTPASVVFSSKRDVLFDGQSIYYRKK